MKILSISIRNFRSFKDVTLSDLGNLVVIIGPNSSGKTNLMEAVAGFFSELDPAVSRDIGRVGEFIWFNKNPKEPITFSVTLGVPGDELRFYEGLSKFLKMEPTNKVEITRSITGTPSSASWRTDRVAVNGNVLVEGGKLFSKELQESKSIEGIDPGHPLSAEQLLSMILQGMSSTFKDIFRTGWAVRNYVETSKFGVRTSLLQPTTLSDLTSLSQSLETEKEGEWNSIEGGAKKTEPRFEDIRTVGAYLSAKEKDGGMRFPVNLVGGGHQEVLDILHLLREKRAIFGLEEPEAHLHPQLARRLFTLLKDISKATQIFLTTHSSIFVDTSDLQQTFVVTRRGKESTIKKVQGPNDLRELLFDLGARPSDILLSNGILFVEGETERIFIPRIAQKMGIDFGAYGLSIVPTYGKSNGRYHLKVWVDVASNTNVPFFMILDKDAEKEAKDLTKIPVLRKGENLFLLERGSTEDYYPEKLLIETVSRICDLEDEDEKTILEKPRVQSIEKVLARKKTYTRSWKLEVAEMIAESITVDQIDEELKRIFERIGTSLRLNM